MADKPKHESTKRKRIRAALIISGVLVLAVIGGVVVQLVQRKITNDKIAQEQQNEQLINGGPPLPKTVTQSSKLAAQGKTAEAQHQIQQQLNTTTDNNEKYELYLQEGLNYLNQSDYTNALASLQKADALKSDYRINVLLGDVSALQGNKAAAKQYYTKAIPLIDQEDSRKDVLKRDLETKIKNLGI